MRRQSKQAAPTFHVPTRGYDRLPLGSRLRLQIAHGMVTPTGKRDAAAKKRLGGKFPHRKDAAVLVALEAA